MPGNDRLDLTNLPRFLAHLEQRDPGSAGLARGLLASGWDVRGFWGPVQMDVWSLELQRDGNAVVFGIERGFSDGVRLGPPGGGQADFNRLSYAVLAWTRVTGVEMPFDDPEEFHPDIGAYGRPTLDWKLAGDDGAVDRVVSAWKAYWSRRYGREQQHGESWLAETKAWGVRLIEAAANTPSG